MVLQDCLDHDLVSYIDEADDWKDAIALSYKKMIEQGYVNHAYVNEVIACVEKYGPYIVIIPEVAMPHSTLGGDHVFKNGISFMKVEKPVEFDDEEPKSARLFFSIASIDADQHLQNITDLSEILSDEALVGELLETRTRRDFENVVEQHKGR